MPELPLLESEFASIEGAEVYDAWSRAKIEAALDDPSPTMPHDEAMAIIDALIESKRRDAACLGS